MMYIQKKLKRKGAEIERLKSIYLRTLFFVKSFNRSKHLIANSLFAMKLRSLIVEKKVCIVGWHEVEVSGAQIGCELGIAHQTIYDLMERYQIQGTIISPKPIDRRFKLNISDKLQLVQLVIANQCALFAAIQVQMTIRICAHTLQKYVQALGFNNCVAVKKPSLKDAHKTQRLAFAQAHAH